MTQTHPAPPTLAALVDELVIYLRDQHRLQETTHPHPPPPDGLERVFDTFSHHLVALALVARSDDKIAAEERGVILRHCRNRASLVGVEMTRGEEVALEEYLRHFLPTLKQLIPALDRLKHDTKADIAGLISAAHALVEADGTVRLQEVAYLASLHHALQSL
jgi:tellurite resistance protein